MTEVFSAALINIKEMYDSNFEVAHLPVTLPGIVRGFKHIVVKCLM
jgi:hypothetical protein